MTDANGHVRRFSHDDLERQVKEEWLDGTSVIRTICYTFDADGRLLGLPLATTIAAHHGANAKADEANGVAAGNALADRVPGWREEAKRLNALWPSSCSIPAFLDAAKVGLFTRFVFSTLIDAAISTTFTHP